MKYVLLFLSIAITGCANRSGVTQGVLVDAQIDGIFFKSCEIDVQYGKESSRIESFSSRDIDQCPGLVDSLGKTVKVKYHFENFVITAGDNHIFESIETL